VRTVVLTYEGMSALYRCNRWEDIDYKNGSRLLSKLCRSAVSDRMYCVRLVKEGKRMER
jgi:hypothetical protein